MIKELWQYRRYIYNNAVGELKYRYAGSMMGFIWNILNPLFQILVYTFVFTNIMVTRLPGLNDEAGFAIYLCSGLLAWISFAECINRGVIAFQENSNLLKKLPIPEHIFVAKIIVSAAFNAFISYFILFILVFATKGEVTVYWLLVPIVLFLLLVFGFGLALLVSCLNIFFKDVNQIIGLIINIWMWLTPIVYIKEILPDKYRFLYEYNPIYPYIDNLHQLIVYNQFLSSWQWLSMVLVSFAALFIGYFALSKLRKEIRDLL